MTISPSTKIIDWYAALTPDSLMTIEQFYADDARFKDPFNEVRGTKAITAIFTHMFATTGNPRFVFIDVIEQDAQAFLTWTFHFELGGKAYEVAGGSHLRYDASGKIIDHRDYWDPAEELWQKMPLLSVFIRFLRRQFLVKQTN
nr:nuclear transport factor 2 family protein [uncultured Undibacterium sp.]